MNKKGSLLVWIVLLFMLFLVLAITIEPLKEALNNNRNYASGLNCPGTSDFNSAAYNNQTGFEKLSLRSTCFATGLGLVYFIGTIGISIMIWVYTKYKK